MIISADAQFSDDTTQQVFGEKFLSAVSMLASLPDFEVELTDCFSSADPISDYPHPFPGKSRFLKDDWAREIAYGKARGVTPPPKFMPALMKKSSYLEIFVTHSDTWAGGVKVDGSVGMEGNIEDDKDYEAFYEALLSCGSVLVAELSFDLQGISSGLFASPIQYPKYPISYGAGWAFSLGGEYRELMPVTNLRAAGFDMIETENAITATVTPTLKGAIADIPDYLNRRKIFMSLFRERVFYRRKPD